LKSQAPRWATPVGLFTALLDHLRRRRIILPAVSLIEPLAWRAYREVEGEALKQLAGSLRPLQRSELDTSSCLRSRLKITTCCGFAGRLARLVHEA